MARIRRTTLLAAVFPLGALLGLGSGAPAVLAQSSLSEADVASRVAPAVVRVVTPHGSGSGVKVAGGVLTNDHVVADEDTIDVIAGDGRRASATVLRTDPAVDLALLQTSLDLPSVDLEPVEQQRQGDEVLAFGYPMADTITMGANQATLTRGLISAVRHADDGVTYIQTDAAINPGNSGGAMVNLRGHLIGVPALGMPLSPGLNFGIGANTVQHFLQAPPPPPVPAGPVFSGRTSVAEGRSGRARRCWRPVRTHAPGNCRCSSSGSRVR